MSFSKGIPITPLQVTANCTYFHSSIEGQSPQIPTNLSALISRGDVVPSVTGTRIEFTPDKEIFKTVTNFDYKKVCMPSMPCTKLCSIDMEELV
jgi:hypothetical protein